MMILAVFRSRAHSLDYLQKLNAYGIAATTMPTPKEARMGCGICVRFDARDFIRARAILRIGRYSSFKCFYKIDYQSGKMSLTPYYG